MSEESKPAPAGRKDSRRKFKHALEELVIRVNPSLSKLFARVKSGPSERLVRWAEILKTVVEVLAIIAAGWWAYTRYFAGEAPSLEERALVETSIEWARRREEQCTSIVGVSVKNIGKRSFDVESIRIRAWLVDRPDAKGRLVRLDPEAMMGSNQPILDEVINKGSLTGHYPPDLVLRDDYVFVVPYKGDEEKRIAMFRFTATAHASADENKKLTFDDWRWTGNCQIEYGEELLKPRTTDTPTPDVPSK